MSEIERACGLIGCVEAMLHARAAPVPPAAMAEALRLLREGLARAAAPEEGPMAGAPAAETPDLAATRAARRERLRAAAAALRQAAAREGLRRTALAARLGVAPSRLSALLDKAAANEETLARAEAFLVEVGIAPGAPPPPPPPAAPPRLEPVPAALEDARDWLYEEMLRERGGRATHAEIEQRLAPLTPRGVLAECNARRLRHGLPPFFVAGRAA